MIWQMEIEKQYKTLLKKVSNAAVRHFFMDSFYLLSKFHHILPDLQYAAGKVMRAMAVKQNRRDDY